VKRAKMQKKRAVVFILAIVQPSLVFSVFWDAVGEIARDRRMFCPLVRTFMLWNGAIGK